MLDSALLHELAAARKAFVGTVKTALEEVGGELEGKFNQFEKQRVDRLRQERDLENAGKNLARVEAEGRALAQKIAQLTEAATAAEMQASTATGVMSELDEKLKAFAMVEQAIREQQEIKDRHTEGHRLYLGAKQLADQLAIRQEALKKPTDIKAQAREQAQSKVENFEHAAREFDPAALVSARKAASGAEIKLAMDKKASEDSERHLEEERERFRQWQEACLERDRIGREMGRLRAAGGLAKLAASVLKLSAPAVAQHLCSRIAANAQRIFNRINQEAIELEWKAEPQYGLRIVPGERRFAMLSGGEQTKLAVAMTLAMIQEFSALRFAVFDEPTYAVDADSRPKLADAILEAQEVAGLDQLIIVSHDDAFEGRVENVVVLRKLAGSGTELLNSPPLQPPVRP
jgi:exonuclease SbcC